MRVNRLEIYSSRCGSEIKRNRTFHLKRHRRNRMKDATTVLQSSGAGLKLLLLSLAIVSQTYAQESMRDRVQNETGPLMLQKKAQSREYRGREVEGEDRRIGLGDSIWRILVKEKGLSENRFSQYLVIIRGLNPKIRNIDVLKVGDNLFIPLRPDELLAVPAVSAKTDVQRSTVTRGAIKEYRVKQGEHLYQIIREQLGIANDRDVALYYALVKDLNPERKNWDALLGGDLILLPVPEKPGELTVAERKVSIESTPAPEPIKETNPPASVGQVKEDRPSTPRVFGLDYAKQLPAKENLALLGQVVEILGNEVRRDGQESVSQLLSRLGYQSLPTDRPVVIQEGGIGIEAKGNWMALAPEEKNRAQEIFVIALTDNPQDIPDYLRKELATRGLHFKDVLLAPTSSQSPASNESKEFLPAIRQWPREKREFIDAMLLALSVPFGVSETLSTELGQGLKVDVRCDRIFERNGKRTGLFFQRLEPELKRILQERDKIKVVDLDLTVLDHKEIMARLLSELGEQAAYREHRFPASSSKDRLNITAWGFLLARRGMFVTDREIPQSLHRFFFEKGLEIVYF